jgi:hypothetical protein
MRLPLYVSNVFHSMAADRGWRHVDTQTELEMTFVYNTAIMWQEGIRSSDTDLIGISFIIWFVIGNLSEPTSV